MNKRIFEIKNRLNALDIEKSELLKELNELEKLENNSFSKIINRNIMSPEDKIKLFRNLFKGREDVFARKWCNNKGKTGYSPAKNFNDEFISISDEIIKYHLQGINPHEPLYYGKKRDFVIGIYPMLKNENCNFLAVDFDAKNSDNDYKKEILAFINICDKLKIPAYTEISQSGQGAHVWIFFEQEISAINARKLGNLILTLTMEENPNISFKTYDRFFPNQDTMPKGGFGNLIALPLQQKARKENRTIFVDKNFVPYENQWDFLFNIQKISELKVLTILKNHKELDLKNNFYDENIDEPWKLPQKDDFSNIKLPQNLDIILSNKIYVLKDNLHPKLINKFLKLAAFQNPEFYRAQAMRFSTYDKPRIIACGEILQKYICIPRGCLDDLSDFCENMKINLNIQDERLFGTKIKVRFNGKLKPEQKDAFKNIINNDFGILSAPTAFGKTVLASKIISKRKVSTLILAHRKQLSQQWQEKIKEFLDFECGFVGGGKNKVTNIIDVAVMQSLIKKDDLEEFLANYGQLIVDECHHLASYQFEQIAKKFRGKYILGLTATYERKDGHHPIIQMQCGKMVHKVKPINGIFKTHVREIFTEYNFDYNKETFNINELYDDIINDEIRNKLIVENVKKELKGKRACILLTERVDHVEILAELLKDETKNIFILTGKIKAKDLKIILDKIKNNPKNEELLIISTGKYIGEGFDEARLDTLFLTMPISWKGTVTQYVGRLNRNFENKKEVIIYDFIDKNVSVLERMYKKRVKTYKTLGYEFE